MPNGAVFNDHKVTSIERELVYGTVHFDAHPACNCPIGGRSHSTNSLVFSNSFIHEGHRDNYWIELFGGSFVPKFLCDRSGSTVVVNGQFKSEISQARLSGFTVEPLPAPAEFNQSKIARSDLLYFLKSHATDCLRRTKVAIPVPNQCPFCGFGNIVCPACLHIDWNCPQCRHRLVVPLAEHNGNNDQCFTTPGGTITRSRA